MDESYVSLLELFGGAVDIWGSSRSSELAKSMSGEASLMRKYGMEGMEESINRRESIYGAVYNRVYGSGYTGGKNYTGEGPSGTYLDDVFAQWGTREGSHLIPTYGPRESDTHLTTTVNREPYTSPTTKEQLYKFLERDQSKSTWDVIKDWFGG